MSIRHLFGGLRKAMIKEAPTICTFIAVGSMITSVVFAIKDTPKAVMIKEKMEREKGEPLTKLETVKTCLPTYIPTIIFAGLSGFAAFSANNMHKKRYAALLTAYSLTETAFKEYKEQVKDYIGEKKEKENVTSRIAQKHVEENPVRENTKIILTGGGESLFYEPISRQYFKDDLWKVEKKVNKLNQRLLTCDFVSFNEFLDSLDLKKTDPRIGEVDGDSIGWCPFNTGLIEIDYVPTVSNKDEPCFSLVYRINPDDKYMNLH